jgi:hypothetical protein
LSSSAKGFLKNCDFRSRFSSAEACGNVSERVGIWILRDCAV